MFFGNCNLSLGEKCQFSLPSSYRDADGDSVFVTQGFDRNLYILSPDAFSEIYSHVKSTSISDPLARLLNRLFLGSAIELPVDGSGQITLPVSLCEYAELEKEIIIVGQGEYSEIWSPALWQAQLENLKDFEANSHRFEKFNISLG